MIESETRNFHPSSLGYLQVCPRFKNDESRDNSHAERGTKLHEMVATGLGNLDELSEEDRNAVKSCRKYLHNIENMLTVDFKLEKEVRLQCKFSNVANLQGTADVLLTESNGRYAQIVDWKFGFGAVIPAKQNPQTMSYAYMVFAQSPLISQVITTVVCPLQEDNLVDTYTWDRADLPMIKMVLESVINRVLDEKQEPVLNWSVCRYCGNKATCSAMCEVMVRKSELSTPATVLEILSLTGLTPEVRGKWQQVAEWADDWAKQVKRTNLDAALTEGEEIEGYGVVRRKGSLKVENTALAVEKLVSLGFNREIIMSACALSIPVLSTGLENVPDEQRGGAKKAEIRETVEALLQSNIREGEPVVYLKRKTKKTKVKEIE